ncbi:glycine zipper family protein [Rhizosaccharibacter radicis]|uniref:Glycine zipper family protein n=1 Tax=Rhizosaccharibacter radicis TaxID=2782605 RepID=A0ABT1VUU5_9PROT|nr:glycine zipper family protein [Acetobacteraceae bacterium KSS12]
MILASPPATPARRLRPLAALLATTPLLACTVQPPPGPSVLATPGKNKSFAQFQAEDARCRQYAAAANGNVTPGEASNRSAFGSAALGTLLGAGAGALLGAAAGNPGIGAAAGAGGGLLLGSAIGSNRAQASGASFQQRYDAAYIQCTQASGNIVNAPAIVGYSTPYVAGSYAPALTAAPAVVAPAPVVVAPAPVVVAPPPPVVVAPAPVIVAPGPYPY